MNEKTFGRTMQAAHKLARSPSGDSFAKADELVTAKFERGTSLSVPASKVLNIMISSAAGDAWKDTTHIVTRGQLRQVRHFTNAEIEELLDELAGVRFKIRDISLRNRPMLRRRPLFRFIDEEATDQDDDRIEYEFDDTIREILARSDHYTVLYLKTILAFDSGYALRLYDFGSRQARLGKPWEGTVDELRELVGVEPGRLRGWADFRRKVLDIAKSEINQLATFWMDYEVTRKRGLEVIGVRLTFWMKDNAGVEQAWRDIAAHRTVRRARRRGGDDEHIVTPADRAAELAKTLPTDEEVAAAGRRRRGADHEQNG